MRGSCRGRHRVWAAVGVLLVALLAGATSTSCASATTSTTGARRSPGSSSTTSTPACPDHHPGRRSTQPRQPHRPPQPVPRGAGASFPVCVIRSHGVTRHDRGRRQPGSHGCALGAAIDVVLKQAGGDASKRVTLLDTVLQQLDVVQGVVEKVHVGAHQRLLSPLAGARRKLVSELDGAPARLTRLRSRHGAAAPLVGPSRYLLLASNNAEMRGGGRLRRCRVASSRSRTATSSSASSSSWSASGSPGPRTCSPPPAGPTRTTPGCGARATSRRPPRRTSRTGPIYQAMSPAAGFGKVDGVLDVDAVALRNPAVGGRSGGPRGREVRRAQRRAAAAQRELPPVRRHRRPTGAAAWSCSRRWPRPSSRPSSSGTSRS